MNLGRAVRQATEDAFKTNENQVLVGITSTDGEIIDFGFAPEMLVTEVFQEPIKKLGIIHTSGKWEEL